MSQPHSATAATDPIERAKALFTAWEDFFHGRDMDGLLGLYHQDALLESPIIPRLLDQKDGAVHGHSGIRTFYAAIFAEISDLSDHPEIKYLTDGTTLTWAYTRKVPGGETLYDREMRLQRLKNRTPA